MKNNNNMMIIMMIFIEKKKRIEGDNDKHVGSMMIMRNSKGGSDWLILYVYFYSYNILINCAS